MKKKVSELFGASLDWAVAKCESLVEDGVYGDAACIDERAHLHYCGAVLSSPYSPSSDWSTGGPIIERELIELDYDTGIGWEARDSDTREILATGPTSLIAAMRCYVAYKLGDEIELPEEFC